LGKGVGRGGGEDVGEIVVFGGEAGEAGGGVEWVDWGGGVVWTEEEGTFEGCEGWVCSDESSGEVLHVRVVGGGGFTAFSRIRSFSSIVASNSLILSSTRFFTAYNQQSTPKKLNPHDNLQGAIMGTGAWVYLNIPFHGPNPLLRLLHPNLPPLQPPSKWQIPHPILLNKCLHFPLESIDPGTQFAMQVI
jgi:hypothetical protein